MTMIPEDPQDREEREERESIEDERVSAVAELLDAGDAEGAADSLADLRPAEVAYVLEHLDEADVAEVVAQLDTDVLTDVIEYAEPHTRAEIVQALDPEALTEALTEMPDDVAADIVQDLDPEAAAIALDALPADRRQEIEQLLHYAEDTAGGRMTGQVITVDPWLTVSETVRNLRDTPADASKPFYLYVVDADRRLMGVLNLRALITAHANTPVTEVMTANVITVEAHTDQEEAARLLARHNLLALPVVDAEQRLLGTVTSDDLIDVLEEEASEDMYRMAGVHEEEDLSGVFGSVRHRLPWLMVNLVTAMAAAWVVSRFEGTVEQVAILAAFLPVIGGQGGNAGIQTLTVIVRSLALGRIGVRDTAHLIWHEMRVGLLLGTFTGVAVGVIAFAWQGNPWLGGVVMLALTVNTVVGAIAGVLIPMALERFKQDPALSGGVWLTTATDLSGFFAFLGTATFLVDRLS
ncbi:MAG: magnesium transporter MgtE [Chloroflexota bacterium]